MLKLSVVPSTAVMYPLSMPLKVWLLFQHILHRVAGVIGDILRFDEESVLRHRHQGDLLGVRRQRRRRQQRQQHQERQQNRQKAVSEMCLLFHLSYSFLFFYDSNHLTGEESLFPASGRRDTLPPQTLRPLQQLLRLLALGLLDGVVAEPDLLLQRRQLPGRLVAQQSRQGRLPLGMPRSTLPAARPSAAGAGR